MIVATDGEPAGDDHRVAGRQRGEHVAEVAATIGRMAHLADHPAGGLHERGERRAVHVDHLPTRGHRAGRDHLVARHDDRHDRAAMAPHLGDPGGRERDELARREACAGGDELVASADVLTGVTDVRPTLAAGS